jgi:hypothetical protein
MFMLPLVFDYRHSGRGGYSGADPNGVDPGAALDRRTGSARFLWDGAPDELQ